MAKYRFNPFSGVLDRGDDLPSAGAVGEVLTSQGPGVEPTWSTISPSVVQDLAVQGTLAVGDFRTITSTGSGFLSTADHNLLRWVGGSNFEARGIIGDKVEGAFIVVLNDTTNTSELTLLHESNLASSDTQIDTIHNSDVVLGKGDSATLFYSETTDKYVLVEVNRSSDIVNTPTQIVGNTGKVTTESSNMISGFGNMVTSGVMQVQNAAGTEAYLQVRNDTLITSSLISKRQEGYNITLTVGTTWLFNSATAVDEAVVKVTMQASDPTKTVDLATGSHRGYVVQVYKGDHPNHVSNFTVNCAGSGIVGYANGILISGIGDAITLRQTGSSEYIVESANFDITPQKA